MAHAVMSLPKHPGADIPGLGRMHLQGIVPAERHCRDDAIHGALGKRHDKNLVRGFKGLPDLRFQKGKLLISMGVLEQEERRI